MNTTLIGEVSGMAQQAKACAGASRDLLAVLAEIRKSAMIRDCEKMLESAPRRG